MLFFMLFSTFLCFCFKGKCKLSSLLSHQSSVLCLLLNFVFWTLFPPFFRIAFPLVHVWSFENCIILLSGCLSILSNLTLKQKYGAILSTHEDTILQIWLTCGYRCWGFHAGTTIAGIHELEKMGFRAALMNAVLAATERGEKFSK
jgi:hypothetical protein